MIIVTFLGIARYATQVAQISIGNGRHRWYIPKENYIRNNMLGWVAQILLFASICLLKVSILLLLLRIKNSRGLRWSAWAVMAGLVITNFGCIVILLAECDPVEAYWTGSGKCWDARVRIYAIYLTIGMSHVERQTDRRLTHTAQHTRSSPTSSAPCYPCSSSGKSGFL